MKARLIPISITKANLNRISIDFKDEKNEIEVTVNLVLQTENGTRVTNVTFASDAWNDDQKIKPSMDIIPWAAKIRQALEETCICHINRQNKMLASKEVKI